VVSVTRQILKKASKYVNHIIKLQVIVFVNWKHLGKTNMR